MLVLVFLTFLLTIALFTALFWLAARKVATHVREHPAAAQALLDHLLVPLFARPQVHDADEEHGPAPDDAGPAAGQN